MIEIGTEVIYDNFEVGYIRSVVDTSSRPTEPTKYLVEFNDKFLEIYEFSLKCVVCQKLKVAGICHDCGAANAHAQGYLYSDQH